MIETQIIHEGKKPVAVVIDYEEYKLLKKIEEEYRDYADALNAEEEISSWHSHESVKNDLGL